MRLVATNGSTVDVSSGTVQICFDETWGTVSDGQWAATAAGVVCSQLGFSRFSECNVFSTLEDIGISIIQNIAYVLSSNDER